VVGIDFDTFDAAITEILRHEDPRLTLALRPWRRYVFEKGLQGVEVERSLVEYCKDNNIVCTDGKWVWKPYVSGDPLDFHRSFYIPTNQPHFITTLSTKEEKKAHNEHFKKEKRYKTKICQLCGEEFVAVRSTAKYCPDRKDKHCRKWAQLNKKREKEKINS